MRVRIKICGVTTATDARTIAETGADMIGMNLFAGPRKIDLKRASEILDVLPPRVVPVVLVGVDQGGWRTTHRQWIIEKKVAWVQVYGAVTPDVVRAMRDDGLEPIFVASALDGGFSHVGRAFLDSCGEHQPAAVLLDSASVDQAGGTGDPANWDAIAAARGVGDLNGWPPLWLAGGLRSSNVAEAIRVVRPTVVDVSSGVERRPGRKDGAKVKSFVRAVGNATD